MELQKASVLLCGSHPLFTNFLTLSSVAFQIIHAPNHASSLGMQLPGSYNRNCQSLGEEWQLPSSDHNFHQNANTFFSTQLPINLRCGGRICCVNDCLRYFPRNWGPESKLKDNPQSHLKIWRGYTPTKQF